MSAGAGVELPPFKRCSNALIFFSNALNFSGLVLPIDVVTDSGRNEITDRKNIDETYADGIFNATRDDGLVRRGLFNVEYVSACAAATRKTNMNGTTGIAL